MPISIQKLNPSSSHPKRVRAANCCSAISPSPPVNQACRLLSLKSLDYFLDHAHPFTGLVRDHAENFVPTPFGNRIASMAATGFGLAVLANAAERGIISPQVAAERILRTLRFAQTMEHRNGWLYHFVDWENGKRFGKSEISTIDTSLFIAGALYAGQVFPNSEISRTAAALYERMDFPEMMTNGGSEPGKRVLSHGWTPESGYIRSNWDSYSELMLLVLLGMGHPTRPLPSDCWSAWSRPGSLLPDGSTLIGANLPLFAHEYSHLFVDFRNRADIFGIDYFRNSMKATNYNRATCRSMALPTYRQGFWGLSACDAPNGGYAAYSPVNQDGTVCLGAAAASVAFSLNTVEGDLQSWMYGPYRWKIVGKYGFADGINLGQNWIDSKVLGITAGPAYLAIANLDPRHSIWGKFNKIPAIERGMARAGFK